MSEAAPLIVIFGALVRPDGSPSAALVRRIGYGFAAAQAYPDAPILCSGGVCRSCAPSEASIMGRVLADRGIGAERLILDECSLTTIENVAAAASQALAGGHPFVVACSDGYHMPRIRLLLALHGVKSRPGPGGERAPVPHGLGMGLRECLAAPHNLAQVVARRVWRRTS